MVNNKRSKEFRQRIGRIGGLKSRGGGFADPKVGRDGLTGAQRAQQAGVKGGSVKGYKHTEDTKRRISQSESLTKSLRR